MAAASLRAPVMVALCMLSLLACPLAAEAKAKYCASRVVRGVDFTRTGSYVEYDRPASVDNCCHACAGQQVKSGRKTGLFVCKAWIMTRHSIYNGSKGGVCLTLPNPLSASVLNAKKGTPYNKISFAYTYGTFKDCHCRPVHTG